jgi:hypothetical protein
MSKNKPGQNGRDKWPEGDTMQGFEAYSRRVSAHSKLLQERARLPDADASKAILHSDPATKEVASLWLRGELYRLREQEKIVGAAPVLKEKLVSRLLIADLAMTMLECCSVGDELIGLFAELLDVDRHRKALADNHSEAKQRAISIEAQTALTGRKLGVRQLAKVVAVAPATILTWRKSTAFQEQVELESRAFARVLRDHYFAKIQAEAPDISEHEAFAQAMELYILSIPERRGRYGSGV